MEVEALQDMVSGLEAQLRDLMVQNTQVKQAFIDYSRQFEHMMHESEQARMELQQENQHLNEAVAQLTVELRRARQGEPLDSQEGESYQDLLNERNRMAKKLKVFESKFKNIDLDALHTKNQLLQTKLDQVDRESLHVSFVIEQLTGGVDKATKMYLKIRKQRELEWDLPGEEVGMVDNRNWRKLLEMEKKAYKLVEEIAGMCSQAAKVGIIRKTIKA